ncbi:hypothetical protein CYMTET_16238 [Cymbomonas tetramitiformis]|uniref:Prolyl endopeptidase n=1 Tax=Cymbomonas tetramitiformis TaxID=36881 RepID=A0AAE0L8G7_9CHLO|nr:hypothetical protein CYMTET_16238 [Cymbomonas tetramitiformis]
MEMFAQVCVLYERHLHGQQIRAVPLPAASSGASRLAEKARVILLPSAAANHGGGGWNIQPAAYSHFDADRLCLSASSPACAPVRYDYNLVTHTLHLDDTACNNATEEHALECYVIQAVTADGIQVPITVAHRKDISLCGQNPLLLHAYGVYGISLETPFEMEAAQLMRRGFVFAWAHIRGGGEGGRCWHAAAMQGRKQVSIDDLNRCSEELVRRGYTSADRMAGSAASAGGAIMLAAAQQRPELWRALVLQSPFVSVLAAMSAPQAALTVEEYEEWGNPHVPDQLKLMQRYCPEQNWTAAANGRQHALAVLVHAAPNDPRVSPHGALRFAAAMRGTSCRVMLRMTSGGHFGNIEEKIHEYAFLIKTLRQLA